MAPPWRHRTDELGLRVNRTLAPLRRRAAGRRRVAFVLSGGGSLGAVQVGMLRALVEYGIKPDVIIGCSVGAINGAGFAADPTVRGVARMERLWRRLAAGNPAIMPAGFIPLAVQLARKGPSLHDPAPLERLLNDELPVREFSQLRIPFQCVATDLQAAAEHWFDSGLLVPALMASASLPAVYPARELDGRLLIDGGVLNEIHTHRAVALGATELYVLHVGHLGDRSRPVQRPFDSAMRAYWTARRHRYEDDLRRVPSHCVVHQLPAGETPRLRFDDFSHVAELIELAHRHTAAYLEQRREPVGTAAPPRARARMPAAVNRARSGDGPAPGRLAFTAEGAVPAPGGGPSEPLGPDAPADEALGLATLEGLMIGPDGDGNGGRPGEAEPAAGP